MKKMLIMLTVIGLAVSAQAVVLGWNFTDASSTTFGGTNFNTVNSEIAIYSSVPVITSMTDFGASFTQVMETKDLTVNNEWGAQSLGATPPAQGTNYYIVIFDGSGNALISEALTYTGLGGSGWTSVTNSGTGLPGFDFSPGVNGGWAMATEGVVPEPTSMALLMLGIAAVGLRRKVRQT